MKILGKLTLLLLSCTTVNVKSKDFFTISSYKNGYKGILNDKGVLALKLKTELIYSFSYPWKYSIVGLDDRFGLINKRNGELLVKPRFKYLSSWNNKYAFAFKNDNWGIIDTQGNWILKPKYSKINLTFYNSADNLLVYSAPKGGYWEYII